MYCPLYSQLFFQYSHWPCLLLIINHLEDQVLCFPVL